MTVNDEALTVIRDAQALTKRIQDDHTRAITLAWVEVWDTLAPEFEGALVDVMGDAEDGRVSRAQMSRATRLARALDAAHTQLELLAQENTRLAVEPLPEAVQAVVEANAAAIGAQLPAAGVGAVTAGAVVGFDRMDSDALAAIVTRTNQQITASHYPLADDAVAVMKQELIRGVATGDNPRRTASRMVKRAESGFNGGLSRALTIARTETIGAHNASADITRQANRDVVANWVWVAALDRRCCPACLVMHGQKFPIDTPGPEGHPNCRCTSVPVTKTWAELGIPGMEEFDLESPVEDAEQWFQNLNPESQRDIMGPARLELYQSGEVAWKDLAYRKENPDWRASYMVTPVKDLL